VRISLGTAQHATQASVDPYMIVLPGNSKNFDQRFYEYVSTQSCGGRIAFLLKEIWLASTDRRHS
jgi:hypothetical protein